jgi:3-hydroxybutyryl-CoA dehydratase
MVQGDIFNLEYTVTENVYNLFIAAFNDKNPLHTDDNFAIGKSFKEKVMHGAILAGFLSNFIGECLPTKNVLVRSYKIDFIRPVYLGDILFFRATITGFFESVNAIEFEYNFKNNLKQTIAKGTISIGII